MAAGKVSAAALVSGAVQVQQPVHHMLSKELQLYFDKVGRGAGIEGEREIFYRSQQNPVVTLCEGCKVGSSACWSQVAGLRLQGSG